MPKKPHSKLGRLALLLIEIWGSLTALAIIALLVFESLGPIDAAIWHMRHGSTVSFDGHRFHLPRSWYPDPSSHPGQLSLQRAQFGSAPSSRITLATEPRPLNDQAAVKEIAAMTANLNQQQAGSSIQWTTETLRSRTLTLHCTASATGGSEQTIICQAANSNLRTVTTTSGPAARAEAQHIIESSE